MNNLAYRKAQTTCPKDMRHLLQQDLEVIDRPFGEFVRCWQTVWLMRVTTVRYGGVLCDSCFPSYSLSWLRLLGLKTSRS